MTTETVAATPTTGPFTLFLSVAGRQGGKFGFGNYVFISELESSMADVVCSNENSEPVLLDGSQYRGLWEAILAALPHVPDGSDLYVYAPQLQVHQVFHRSRFERRSNRYRGATNKTLKNDDLIQEIDDITEKRHINLHAPAPSGGRVEVALNRIRVATSARYEAACDAVSTEKF